jgi:hypothetical protein
VNGFVRNSTAPAYIAWTLMGARSGQSPGGRDARCVQYSHYSLLTTVEAIFNLGTLGRNDLRHPMSDLFRGGIP